MPAAIWEAHCAVPPTKTAAEMAIHRWPAAPKAAPASAAAVASGKASGSTTAWFLAPAFACKPCAGLRGQSMQQSGKHALRASRSTMHIV